MNTDNLKVGTEVVLVQEEREHNNPYQEYKEDHLLKPKILDNGRLQNHQYQNLHLNRQRSSKNSNSRSRERKRYTTQNKVSSFEEFEKIKFACYELSQKMEAMERIGSDDVCYDEAR